MTSSGHSRFNLFVLPHLDEGYRLARWLTGDRSDAEDVVQDACLRAYRAIETFKEDSPRAWFLTIVRNAAYSWLQRHRPKTLVFTEDVGAAEAEADPAQVSPEAALMAKEDAGRLSQAIDALPLAVRETLVLREHHGLSYREIAGICDVPIGTVMSRLARSRGRLIAVLEGAGS